MKIFTDDARVTLANICRVAATRFREHAEHLSTLPPTDGYKAVRHTFVEQMLQAEDMAEALETAEDGFAVIPEGADPEVAPSRVLMALIEDYVRARIAEDRADADNFEARESSVRNLHSRLSDQIAKYAPAAEPSALRGFGA